MWSFLGITMRSLRSWLSCFEAVWGHLRLVHVSGHLINRLTQIHLQYTCIDHKNKVTLQFWTKNILATVFSIPTPLSQGSFSTFLRIYKDGSHKTLCHIGQVGPKVHLSQTRHILALRFSQNMDQPPAASNSWCWRQSGLEAVLGGHCSYILLCWDILKHFKEGEKNRTYHLNVNFCW